MLTFGTTTFIDFLSWVVAVSLGAKVLATILLLAIDKSDSDRPGWGTALWWATKLTPIVAVPCVAWIALIEHDRELLWVMIGLAAFVAIAVPLKIRQRNKRIVPEAHSMPA